MNIFFISNSFYPYNTGGAELQLYMQCKYLISKGYNVFYIFLDKKNIQYPTHYESIKLIPIPYRESWINKYFLSTNLIYYNKIKCKVKNLQIDVAINRNLSSLFLPFIKKKCKTIIEVAHQKDVSPGKFNYNIGGLIENYFKKFILKRADIIMAQANYQNKLLRSFINRKNDIVVYNCHPIPKSNLQKSKKIKIIWVANFRPFKQPEKFLEIASKTQGYEIEFVMVGRITNEATYINFKHYAKNFGVNYIGELSNDDVNKLIETSHILVNTSVSEGFPNVFIQAWMRKVVVLSLNVDPDGFLQRLGCGPYSGSTDNLALDLIKLVSNISRLEELGKKSRNMAMKYFSESNLDGFYKLVRDNK